jgi:hypothetical protein
MICVLGMPLLPTTSASAGLGVSGAMNAALGFLADFFFGAFLAAFFALFFAAFLGAFFAAFLADFFAVFAIAFLYLLLKLKFPLCGDFPRENHFTSTKVQVLF